MFLIPNVHTNKIYIMELYFSAYGGYFFITIYFYGCSGEMTLARGKHK